MELGNFLGVSVFTARNQATNVEYEYSTSTFGVDERLQLICTVHVMRTCSIHHVSPSPYSLVPAVPNS